MRYQFAFVIPELPATLNSQTRRHWRARKREADKWAMWVMAIAAGNKPRQPLTSARLELTRHSSVCPDYDGLAGSFKHVVDALVTNGIIVDDNMDVIGMPEFKWVKAGPNKGFIEVVIREVE